MPKVERRNAGTEFLKECIADSLIKLMGTRPFDKITSTEITNLANVGRATYFRQFNSKEDVLSYKIKLLWSRWAEEHHIEKREVYDLDDLETFFEFIYSIRQLNDLLQKADKMNVLLLSLGSGLGINEPEDPFELYRYRFFTMGMSMVLYEWIKRDYKESPRELIAYLKEHAVPFT